MSDATLQERMDAVRTAADRGTHRSLEAARAILEARARLLARPANDANGTVDEAIDLLVVQVGDEQLALGVASIVAIARVSSIAPLPRAVAPVHGVTAWRGRPLTVLALAPGRPVITTDTRLVVLGSGARAALAIVVDAVHDVARTPRRALSPAGPGPRQRHALGMTTDGLLVLDGEILLHPERLTT